MNRRDFLKKSAVALTSAVVGASILKGLEPSYPGIGGTPFEIDGQVLMSMGAGKQPAWTTIYKEPFGIIEFQNWSELNKKL